MFIKIFFGEKPLFLCDAVDETILPYIQHDGALFIDELNSRTVKTMIQEMQQDHVKAGVFYHTDLVGLKKLFWKKFTVILAGGGVVENEYEEILLIFRRGKWDLPKGKINPGESIEACALREVEEETGLQQAVLSQLLLITFHTYHEGARFILKESHWFKMNSVGVQSLQPQVSEEIYDLRWIRKKELEHFIPLVYPSVADVIKQILFSESK